MNSVPSKLENRELKLANRQRKNRSMGFLLLLVFLLGLAVLFSLKSGSYETPAAEIIKGIFGRSADRRINLVIQNNRMPR